MIQEGFEVVIRVEGARLAVGIIKMNAFSLKRHGEQNDVIIEAMVGGASSRTDFVPMCSHVFELFLLEGPVAVVCGTYEEEACLPLDLCVIVPM